MTGSGPPVGAVVLRGVTKRFGGTTALDDVSFTAPAQQVTGVIGPNGSGKTTTLKCVSGFLQPNEGAIELFGEPTTGASPAQLFRRGLVQTFQRVALAEDMTVAENVLLGADGRRLGKPIRLLADLFGLDDGLRGVSPDHVVEILGRVALEAFADELVGNLPLGIRRRVELARALLASPRLLLLDEPASGLDARESAEFIDLLASVRADDPDLTILIVEHDLEVIAGVCDELVVLDFGRRIAGGGVRETLADPSVRAAYLGSAVV